MKQIIKETRTMEYHAILTSVYPELKVLKAQDKRASFNQLIEKALPDMRRYIARELEFASSNHLVPEGKYELEDFLDELYIKAYDHFEEIGGGTLLRGWLFRKADELFQDVIIEEEFHNAFCKNIDDFSSVERDAMIEKISRDADGDLVMEEELEDMSYAKHKYKLDDIFVEDTQQVLIDKLDKDLTEERIDKQITLALKYMPSLLRNIFDLSVVHKFNEEEIANIRNLTVQEVNRYLADVKQYTHMSFENR